MSLKFFIYLFILLEIFRFNVIAQKPSKDITELINKLPCSSFEWVPWKGFSDKGAMRVPIKFSGKTYWFQLDTGAPATIIYGKPDQSLDLRKGQNPVLDSVRVTDIEFGGMKIPVGRFYIMPDMKPGETTGTVGLDLFMGNVAVIDYPGKRFCLMPNADVPMELYTKSHSVKALIRDGKFFIEAKLNGQKLNGLFFDSGASALPLSVDFEEWKSITGLSGEEQATQKVAGSSWGKPMLLVGGESKGELEIGSINLGRQMAFYRSESLEFFKKTPYQTIGHIGNAPFFDRVIVLDLSVYPAFRIFK